MAVLAILEADARAAARLSTALGGEHRVVVRSTWESLHRALARESFDACLVDADHPDRASALREIATIRDQRPGVAIIACVGEGYDLGYYDLGELGLAGLIASRTLPATKLRAEVDRALATARADRITRSLEGRFAPPGPDAIRWAVEHAGSDTSVEKLAAGLGHTPRSLRQALEEAGLPGPTRILLWGRLLLAGARLGRDGRTVEDVAFSLGYSTATSLARAMKRQTGLTPGEVSTEGGMERVRQALFPEPRRKSRGGLGKIASLVLLAVLAGCATFAGGSGTGVDRAAIEDRLRTPPLDRAHVGVLVVDLRTGRTLYERDADRWFVPASNQKIVVTAAAWSLLGPDYRYRTEVRAEGTLAGGRLDGDLVVIGSGDPSLSRRYWPSGLSALDALADSLRRGGLREVTGSLIVDVSAWDSTTVAPTREVDDLVVRAGATGGAFAIEEGELHVVTRGAARAGEPADVEWTPRGPGGVFSRVTTALPGEERRVTARYQPESRQLVLEGAVAPGAADSLVFAQRDPVRVAAAELAAALERTGITVRRGWRVRWEAGDVGHLSVGVPGCRGPRRGATATCHEGAPLAVLESPPLSELAAGVLGPSQNWMAEQLLLTLGAELGERGSWSQGLTQVSVFLAEAGIEPQAVRPRDGSGLSAYNLVTPRALVRLLQLMAARADAGLYRRALAEPGEIDSTLEDRIRGLEGRVFAKTGSISNVNNLSGYLVRESGQELIFSILTNGTGVSATQVRDAIDDLVRTLAR